MNGTFFDIGLGAGLAAACGLRPFLPLLLAGILGSASALGVSFSRGSYEFLQAGWWLVAVAALLVVAYGLQLALAPAVDPSAPPGRTDPFGASLTGLGLGAGAVLFGGALAGHGDSAWPGLVGGILVAGLAQRASGPVILRARTRLPDRAAREALTVYLDAASLLLVAIVALLHPLGYLAVVLLAWFIWRGRSRANDKYAGLRILRR